MSMKLLIVEDEANLMRLYSKSVKKWNKTDKETIEMFKAKNKDEGRE